MVPTDGSTATGLSPTGYAATSRLSGHVRHWVRWMGASPLLSNPFRRLCVGEGLADDVIKVRVHAAMRAQPVAAVLGPRLRNPQLPHSPQYPLPYCAAEPTHMTELIHVKVSLCDSSQRHLASNSCDFPLRHDFQGLSLALVTWARMSVLNVRASGSSQNTEDET